MTGHEKSIKEPTGKFSELSEISKTSGYKKNPQKIKDRNVYDSSVYNILEPGNNTNAHQ